MAEMVYTYGDNVVNYKVVNGVLRLECQGCWELFKGLSEREWRDRWDTGQVFVGAYCVGCCETIDGGHPLPNMRASYRRPV